MSIEAKQNLSDHQMNILNSELEKHKKSTGLAYVLLIFLGSLGIHKFYIGKVKWGLAYLFLGIFGWVFIFSGGIAAIGDVATGSGLSAFGLICLIVLGILCFIDLFTLPGQIRKIYEATEEKLINNLLNSN